MRLSLLTVLAILACYTPVLAQPLPNDVEASFAVEAMNPLLMLGSDAVLRLDQQRFTVKNPGRATLEVRQVVTVLNANGRDWASVVVSYDKLRKLGGMKGWLLDANGKVIRKLSKEDIIDQSAISSFSLYEDNRVCIANMNHNSYPYTVKLEYELDYHGISHWPTWRPQSGGLATERGRFEIVSPQGTNVRHLATGLAQAEPEVIAQGNKQIHRWDTHSLPSYTPEPWGPKYRDQMPAVYTASDAFKVGGTEGDMSSWTSFGAWYNRLTEGRDELPDEARAEVRTLLDGVTDDREKVRLLYDHLQNKTRYVSVQLGLGGWQPFDAEYVYSRSYGDCKALTNYMQALLKEAGIASYPALIGNGTTVPDTLAQFPSNQFNHAILYVPLAQDTLWLETTSQTIPFGHIGPGNENRLALVARPEGGELVRTVQSTATDNQQVRTAEIILSAQGNATAEITTFYTGNQQDRVRQALQSARGQERERRIHAFLDLPSATLTSMRFDHEGSVEATLAVEAEVRSYAASMGSRLFLTPNLMEQWSTVPPELDAPRTQPIVHSYAYADTDTIRYVIPDGYTIEAMPEPVSIAYDFGKYEAATTLQDDGSLLFTRFVTITDTRIPPDEYENFRTFRQTAVGMDKAQIVLVKK
ncbi:MAG: DUF3857 and transglutaminase domain-containing protein [Bacteroidota bacterium]